MHLECDNNISGRKDTQWGPENAMSKSMGISEIKWLDSG